MADVDENPLSNLTDITLKQGQTRWTRKELILAINLYLKIPFGKIHTNNPDVIRLAEQLRRTPSAISWNLANFANIYFL